MHRCTNRDIFSKLFFVGVLQQSSALYAFAINPCISLAKITITSTNNNIVTKVAGIKLIR